MVVPLESSQSVAREQLSNSVSALETYASLGGIIPIRGFQLAYNSAATKGAQVSDLLDKISPELVTKIMRQVIKESVAALYAKLQEIEALDPNRDWLALSSTKSQISEDHLAVCNKHLALAAAYGINVGDLLGETFMSAADRYQKIVGDLSSPIASSQVSNFHLLCKIAFTRKESLAQSATPPASS